MWEGQLVLADGGWRVIAPHFRGVDAGKDDPPTVSIDDYAADVIDLLDALHIDQAVIGGLSMGGYAAFAILRHAARYVQGLILADTRAEADTPEGLEGRRKMLDLVQSKGAAAVAEEMIPKLLGETTRRSRAGCHRPCPIARPLELARGDCRRGARADDAARFDAAVADHPCADADLVGAEDTVTPPPLSEKMHHAIAGSELTVIPGAGHLTNLEQPDALQCGARAIPQPSAIVHRCGFYARCS